MFKTLFTVFILALPNLAVAESICNQLLQAQDTTKTFSSNLKDTLIETLKVENLLDEVDLGSLGDVRYLNPSSSLSVYTVLDKDLLVEKEFYIDELNLNLNGTHRIVETDFGFAVLDSEALEAWSMLEQTLSDSVKAGEFIEYVSLSEFIHPGGITKRATDWLRKSRYLHFKAQFLAENFFREKLNNSGESVPYRKIFIKRKLEYQRLTKKDNTFMFPFDSALEDGVAKMSDTDAQSVLTILARHFILSHMFVKKRLDNTYVRLGDILDRDSLFLISRFPELFPIYPLLKSGHFHVETSTEFVGSEDLYSIGSNDFEPKKVKLNLISQKGRKGVSSAVMNVNLLKKFNIFVEGRSETQQHKVRITAELTLSFKEKNRLLKNVNRHSIDEVFIEDVLGFHYFLNRQVELFNSKTGYHLPEAQILLSDDSYEDNQRTYTLSFGNMYLKPHVLSAFYIFLNSQIRSD